jgi:hypothetical protein
MIQYIIARDLYVPNRAVIFMDEQIGFFNSQVEQDYDMSAAKLRSYYERPGANVTVLNTSWQEYQGCL